MVQVLHFLSVMLGCRIASVSAGICFSDQADDGTAPIQATAETSADYAAKKGEKLCLNKPPAGGKWACEDPSIDFPTVDCLIADVKTCGIIGADNSPSVFYSFGIDNNNIRGVRDQAAPNGNVYFDMLDLPYWEDVMTGRLAQFRLDLDDRLNVYKRRSAEALAATASGEALVMINKWNGDFGGLGGIFQNPKPRDPKDPNMEPNYWLTYELPILQRNPAITRIVSIEVSNNFERHVDWENGQSPPGLGFPLLPLGNAMSVPLPPIDPKFALSPRDENSSDALANYPTPCAKPPSGAAVSPTSSTTSPASSITPPPTAPKPSCVLHEQDPDQGITQAYCLCDSTATLSPLSVAPTGHQSDSCAYTTMPTTAKETVRTFASTYTKDCQGCTQIGFNAPSCTTVAGCTPTSAQVTVQAGSSPVHVGTLTGTALYTSVSSALEKLCPTVSQTTSDTACSTGTVAIPEIEYVSAGSLNTDGELVIKVAASAYNTTALRDAMIKSAALTAQKGSVQNSSCSTQSYTTLIKKRHELPSPLSRIYGRRFLSSFSGLFTRDRPEPTTHSSLFCHTSAFAGVGYFSTDWRRAAKPGAEAYIDATWEFERAPGGDFLCDLIEDLEVALAVVAPEFAPQDLATIPEIQAYCGSGEL